MPELFRKHPKFSSSKAAKADLLDFELLFQLAAEKDKTAMDILTDCLNAWSAAIITMIHAYDPEMVIIGGGVMKSEKQILPYIQQKVNQYAWTPWGKVAVKSAKFTDEAGQLGITYLLNRYLNNK